VYRRPLTDPAPREYHSTWAGWAPSIGALLASGVEPPAPSSHLPSRHGTPRGDLELAECDQFRPPGAKDSHLRRGHAGATEPPVARGHGWPTDALACAASTCSKETSVAKDKKAKPDKKGKKGK